VINQPLDLLVDLASERVGGKVLAANDDFFAPKESLVKEAPPVFDPDRYTKRGKWMDGWETRRRREPGHDWAMVHLGVRGIVRHVLVDTTHFTGNFPEACSVEALDLPGSPPIVELVRDPGRWATLIDREALRGDTVNEFDIDPFVEPATHVRLVIFPDGGVARLRVLGDPFPPEGLLDGSTEVDLAALASGARVIDSSDRHYSSPNRMLLSGKAKGMWDGWETRRRRGPGNDWAVIRLAGPGVVTRLEIDTTHFKGNAPASVEVEAIVAPNASLGDLRFAEWHPLLAETPIDPDTRHRFNDLEDTGQATTHLRLNIFPDGGIARFRAFGSSDTPWTSLG
jgi:allantoicase